MKKHILILSILFWGFSAGTGQVNTIRETKTDRVVAAANKNFDEIQIKIKQLKNAIDVLEAEVVNLNVLVSTSTLWGKNGDNIYNTNSGNVGIKNNNPAYALDVGSNCVKFSDGVNPTRIAIRSNNGLNGYIIISSTGGIFWTTGNP